MTDTTSPVGRIRIIAGLAAVLAIGILVGVLVASPNRDATVEATETPSSTSEAPTTSAPPTTTVAEATEPLPSTSTVPTSTVPATTVPTTGTRPSISCPTAASGPLLETTTACYQGRIAAGVEGFVGIRYAEPPVGDLRWARTDPIAPRGGHQRGKNAAVSAARTRARARPRAPQERERTGRPRALRSWCAGLDALRRGWPPR